MQRSSSRDRSDRAARVFGNRPDFWLYVQRGRSDLWEALHSPRELARIERAKPLPSAA